MKKMILLTIMAITFGFLVTNNARAGVIDDRMHKQRWHIKQGIKSGELVRFEIKILKQEQRRIKMAKRYAKSNCGRSKGKCPTRWCGIAPPPIRNSSRRQAKPMAWTLPWTTERIAVACGWPTRWLTSIATTGSRSTQPLLTGATT